MSRQVITITCLQVITITCLQVITITCPYFSESLAFCGKPAALFEENQQKSKLNQVCSAQNNVFKTQLYQDLAINTNTYLGSIANFLIIAVPIFSGTYGENQVKN